MINNNLAPSNRFPKKTNFTEKELQIQQKANLNKKRRALLETTPTSTEHKTLQSKPIYENFKIEKIKCCYEKRSKINVNDQAPEISKNEHNCITMKKKMWKTNP